MMVRRGPPGATPTEPETARHIPVLLSEVIESLGPRDGEVFIDATFGAGGCSRAFLKAADWRVLALDRDPNGILGGKAMANEAIQGDEWGAYVTLETFSTNGTRDRLQDASPKATESP